MRSTSRLHRRPLATVAAFVALLTSVAGAQVASDSEFDPAVATPAFAAGSGPRLLFDEAHRNLHTAGGRFAAAAAVATADGFRVEPGREPWTPERLPAEGIVLVANARGAGSDEAPAFPAAEIAALLAWIEGGGGLFLVADHEPFGAAAAGLAAALGVTMLDGSVADDEHAAPGMPGSFFLLFSRENGRLGAHPILEGRAPGERIASVVTFGGQALSVADDYSRLLTFGPAARRHTAAGRDDDEVHAAGGLAQMVAFERGAGRVVVAGEAGMFGAQVIRGEAAARAGVPDPFHFGMTCPGCDNKQLLVNSLRWLARRL